MIVQFAASTARMGGSIPEKPGGPCATAAGRKAPPVRTGRVRVRVRVDEGGRAGPPVQAAVPASACKWWSASPNWLSMRVSRLK